METYTLIKRQEKTGTTNNWVHDKMMKLLITLRKIRLTALLEYFHQQVYVISE